MIYYEFDRTGKGGKYKEMTEAEYELAKHNPERFFLEGWDEEHKTLLYIMECTQDELEEQRAEQKGIKNRLRDSSGHTAKVLSLEGEMLECSASSSVFGESDGAALDDAILESIAKEIALQKLKSSISRLSAQDQLLLRRVYQEQKKQAEIAEEFHCTQQNISRRLKKVLLLLGKYMHK